MSSKKYLKDLFEKSANSLKIPYIKTTPKRLQHWGEKNKPPFIALITVDHSAVKIKNNNLFTFTFGFVCAYDSLKDPTNQQIQDAQDKSISIVEDFIYLIENDPKPKVTASSYQESYREGVYLGVGTAFTITLVIGDLSDRCKKGCDG